MQCLCNVKGYSRQKREEVRVVEENEGSRMRLEVRAKSELCWVFKAIAETCYLSWKQWESLKSFK